MSVIGRLHRVGLALTRRIEELYAESGLSEPEFDLMATLRRSGPPYERAAGELAEHTMVTTGGLTKRVDRLVARGLLERTTGTDDARRRMVRLTPSGFGVIDRAYAAHMANERYLVDLLSPTDASRLEAILRRWQSALATD
ncbi:MarR family transcriptional regulator [Nocardioides mangrovicus]|uniref:MarR family transcriptional regulator n=2 Tax=Nocardioides mangrovicus TaxID=2478913 RepID=A0A3L8P6Y7_9ACTN|nr:MarR family transcriptional regulator [Nocardioides mangrovicus]